MVVVEEEVTGTQVTIREVVLVMGAVVWLSPNQVFPMEPLRCTVLVVGDGIGH